MPGVDNVEAHGARRNELRVYIAGPYTHGDWGSNMKNAIDAGQRVWELGHCPFIPHTMTGIWSVIEQNEWIVYDLKWLQVCDAVIRLDGESEGADSEVEFAELEGIPVFYGVKDFQVYLDNTGLIMDRGES